MSEEVVAVEPQVELTPTEVEAWKVLYGDNDVGGAADPIMEYFLIQRRKLHMGNEKVAKMMLAALMTSKIVGSQGIHPKLSGEKGAGKSSAATSMIPLIHPDYLMSTTFSPKALYDSGVKPGTMIFVDDVIPNDDMTEFLKEKMSTGFHKETVRQTRINNKSTTITAPAGLVFVFTSVTDGKSDQLLNRQTIVCLEKTPEMDEAFCQFHYAQAANGFKDTDECPEFAVCREITRILKADDGVYHVAIPFAHRIEHPKYAMYDRRAIKIFTDFIMAHAVMYRFQREVVDGCIMATEADFHFANEMMDIGEARQIAKMTKDEERLWVWITNNPFRTTSEMARALKKSEVTIKTWLFGEGEKAQGLSSKAPLACDKVAIGGSDGSRRETREEWSATGTLSTGDVFATLRNE